MRFGPGTTAVVTGAASGIGRGLAVELAGRGCAVALVDVDGDGLAETQRRVTTHSSVHRIDVADRDAMAALPEAVRAAHGGVQVLLNNAGVLAMRLMPAATGTLVGRFKRRIPFL